MKILLVNDYATPQGGAEVLTLTMRDELDSEMAADVTFLAHSPQACNTAA
jgi:hypothetical protein